MVQCLLHCLDKTIVKLLFDTFIRQLHCRNTDIFDTFPDVAFTTFRQSTQSLKAYLGRVGRPAPGLCLQLCRQLATILDEVHKCGCTVEILDLNNVRVREDAIGDVSHANSVFWICLHWSDNEC